MTPAIAAAAAAGHPASGGLLFIGLVIVAAGYLLPRRKAPKKPRKTTKTRKVKR